VLSFKNYDHKPIKFHHPERTNYNLVRGDGSTYHLIAKDGELMHTFTGMNAAEIAQYLQTKGFKGGHHGQL
jgi:hypothetical protein